jgi:polyisoprenoid-binding protein YceI
MTSPIRQTALFAMLALLLPLAALAAPTRYSLNEKASTVGFNFTLGGTPQTGKMPIERAEIIVDPNNLAASRFDVTVSVAGARTGLVLATRALISAEVLDAARFPTIRFVSQRIKLSGDGRLSGGAVVTGQLTMHGVTRPVTLNASLYRAGGSAADDLSALTVMLSGQISRSEFGASGYPGLVSDIVELEIVAVIQADN